jgi:hypothetical protein
MRDLLILPCAIALMCVLYHAALNHLDWKIVIPVTQFCAP